MRTRTKDNPKKVRGFKRITVGKGTCSTYCACEKKMITRGLKVSELELTLNML